MMAPLEKPSLSTAIQTQGIMHPEAVETYGKSKVILSIGNGGPGATGLLKALAEDYLATREDDGLDRMDMQPLAQ
ncbi:uncharacterized protein N7484_002047 [Penicillium longicatenatum]|uniref:uncharacterized protein n=1 Tax=Penicillium longicatenatum TaxID=1561947 RepID=UPI0025485989|nr:uncharacterized protein N7484_002047 [Penicillium longicatenatum]KAJ5658398.1 hypothetical protein N7484_002047 [Penicillium longicatenatum]